MTTRPFPKFAIQTVTRGDAGYAAFLIDQDTGETWMLDADLSWKPIQKKKKYPKLADTIKTVRKSARSTSK